MTVDVQPNTTAAFTLIYEELLQRRFGRYEQVIHIDPETVLKADDYKVTVTVLDSRSITMLRAIEGHELKDPDKLERGKT